MHSVLNLKHCLVVAGLEEALEEGAAEVRLAGMLAKRRGWQLLLISNQYHSLWSKIERNKHCWLNALAGLIHDQAVNVVPHSLQLLLARDGQGAADNLRSRQ